MDAFWLSLGMVFLAELGDKTQLVALTMATRFRAVVVLAGIFAATLAVHIISVALGGGLGELLPDNWIQFGAGIAFIGFGLWTLRGDSLDKESGHGRKGLSPFWIVATTFFIAELGDKTMLSTVTLATTYPLIPVWLGSSLGMVVSDGLAIGVGQVLGARLPERAIKIGAACVFVGFGLVSIMQGSGELPPIAWAAGAAVVLGVAALFFRPWRRSSEIPALSEAAVARNPSPQEESSVKTTQ